MADRPITADAYGVIADPTRRRIMELLSDGSKSVSDLVGAFSISQPSISEHLRILREAGLVTAVKTGRRRIYSLEAMEIGRLTDWLAKIGAAKARGTLSTAGVSLPPTRRFEMELD